MGARLFMKNIKFLPLYFVFGLALTACGDSEEVATSSAENIEAQSINTSGIETGLECLKNNNVAMETKTYLGLVSIDQTLYTGIRGISTAKMDDKVKEISSSLMLDDGKTTEYFSWTEAGIITLPQKEPISTYPPAEFEFSMEVAKRIYGDCKSWTVDPKLLQRPEKPQQ